MYLEGVRLTVSFLKLCFIPSRTNIKHFVVRIPRRVPNVSIFIKYLKLCCFLEVYIYQVTKKVYYCQDFLQFVLYGIILAKLCKEYVWAKLLGSVKDILIFKIISRLFERRVLMTYNNLDLRTLQFKNS